MIRQKRVCDILLRTFALRLRILFLCFLIYLIYFFKTKFL